MADHPCHLWAAWASLQVKSPASRVRQALYLAAARRASTACSSFAQYASSMPRAAR